MPCRAHRASILFSHIAVTPTQSDIEPIGNISFSLLLEHIGIDHMQCDAFLCAVRLLSCHHRVICPNMGAFLSLPMAVKLLLGQRVGVCENSAECVNINKMAICVCDAAHGKREP